MSETAIVRAIAEKAARRVTSKVIAALQRITDTLSGDDSELKTTWDEICVQIQHEKAFYWDTYDDTVRAIVGAQIAALSKRERAALWLQTDAGIDWDCKDGDDREASPVCDDDIVEWLTEEHVYTEAANWSNERIRAYLERKS